MPVSSQIPGACRWLAISWLAAWALAMTAHSVQAEDNTGTGGTITYTDSSGLNPVASPPYAGGYVVHTFTSSGTLTIPVGATADVLAVAGGGGGGMRHGGGGGAGGYIYTSGYAVSSGSTSVTVGAGGAGANSSNDNLKAGSTGSNSAFGTITAIGGGGGRTYSGTYNGAGGSGGGGSGGGSNPGGGTGTSGQGRDGGSGSAGGANGGGGGGAGELGGASSGSAGGKGGDGLQTSISGVATYYAGGGGGGGDTSKTGGAGGSGVGGHGGDNGLNTSQTAGMDGTGGGGGGCRSATVTAPGSAGGSGIVIVRYPYDPGNFSIALTSPANNQSFSSTASVSATASVFSGTPPCTVKFYLDGNLVSTTDNAPTRVAVDLGVLAIGPHTIYATATDSTPATVTSETHTFTVDGTPPTLTSIVDNQSGGPVQLNNNLVTYTVTFSEDMGASTVDATDFGNAGSAAITIGTVTETMPTSGIFAVQVTPTSVGTLHLQVNAGADLRDVVGNAMVTTSAILDDTTITVDPDTTAPTPDPMTWASVPTARDSSSIAMTASTATDLSGVEYYFECTAGGGNSSGWQASPTYTDTGLQPNTTYTYRVQARDQSPAQNTNVFSTAASATTAQVATFSSSATPPAVDGEDIANFGVQTGSDKWFFESKNEADPADWAKGQTFTTGPSAVSLNALTYKIDPTQKKAANTTYTIRVGTISGTTFNQIAIAVCTQTVDTGVGDYMTWTFGTPVTLLPNTTYGIDVAMVSAVVWGTGIPYLSYTAEAYAGGQLYQSGPTGGSGAGPTIAVNAALDRVFHLDISPVVTQYTASISPPNISGDVTITFDTVSGLCYKVEYTDSLSPIDWIHVSPAVVQKANGITMSVTDYGATAGSPQRFYRVAQVSGPCE